MLVESSEPLLSIIVPTFNEELFLPKLLESVREQSFKDYEIIVADDKSTDLTPKIALQFGAKLITNDGIGEYPSRNAAAEIARGSILVFTGADVMMPPRFLTAIVSKFTDDPRLVGVYCPTYPYDAALWAKIEYTLWYTLTTVLHYITHEANASTSFFAVRAEVFRKVGGFRNTAFADSLLSRQLSRTYKIRPCLDIVIFVSGRRTETGIEAFNRYHIGILFDVVFRIFGRSRWVRAEHEYRIMLHTRSKH